MYDWIAARTLHYSVDGHDVPSFVMVQADSEDSAKVAARRYFRSAGLESGAVTVCRECDIERYTDEDDVGGDEL